MGPLRLLLLLQRCQPSHLPLWIQGMGRVLSSQGLVIVSKLLQLQLESQPFLNQALIVTPSIPKIFGRTSALILAVVFACSLVTGGSFFADTVGNMSTAAKEYVEIFMLRLLALNT